MEVTIGMECVHGVEVACYSGGPGEPYYQLVMQCMCGWSSGCQASWCEAGLEFDMHLDDIREETGG